MIEHVGSLDRQRAFANEVRRVGDGVWVQTPANEFPIEPHYLSPFVHYFPKHVQKRVLRFFSFWGLLTRPSQEKINAKVDEIRLLSYNEMRELFPDCEIIRERFLWMTKSYVAMRMPKSQLG